MTEVKSGYMHKCGKSVKSWKKRWFVLKSNGFLYYFEGPDKAEKGKIDVVDASSIAPWQEVGTAERKLPSSLSGENAFAIVCDNRTYTCVCEENSDCRSWMMAIGKVRAGNNGEQQYPEPTYAKDNQEPLDQEIVQAQAPPQGMPPSQSLPQYQPPQGRPPSQSLPQYQPPQGRPPSQSLPPEQLPYPPQPMGQPQPQPMGPPPPQNMPIAPQQQMPAAMPDPTHYGGSNIPPPTVNPVAGPGFQGSYPVGQYPAAPPMPQPAKANTMPPNYQGPPQPQFYQPAPQYYQGPPRAAYSSCPQRPPPPRANYYRPPPPRPQTNVTIVSLPPNRPRPRPANVTVVSIPPPRPRPPPPRPGNVTVVTLQTTQKQFVYR